MSYLLEIGLSNLLMAALLALVAAVVGRWARRPALTHGLWVLVFLKLITPPFVVVPMGWLDSTPTVSTAVSEIALLPAGPGLPVRFPWDVEETDVALAQAEQIVAVPEAAAPFVGLSNPELVSTNPEWLSTFPWLQTMGWLWILSSASWFVVAGLRVARFRRMLQSAAAAPREIQEEAGRLAVQLGLPRPPTVWLVSGSLSPALWMVGRRRGILIPISLLGRLSREQRATLLAHELAHLRRRDHWVRCLELVVLGLYWWCPPVWWARAELREAEEECCDAWVVWALPGAARAYAFALVETVDFLAGAPPALPQLASGFGPVQRLKRRLTMILRGTAPRTVTVAGGVLLVALGMGLLPLMPSWGQEAQREREQERRKDVERKKESREEGGDRGEELERLRKAQMDLERARAQLEQQRAELERRAAELQRAMEVRRRSEGENLEPKPRQGNTPAPGGPGGTPGRGFGAGKGLGGMPPGGMNPGGMTPPMDIERRLREMERKLEGLLDEMTALRRELSRGPGSGFGAQGMPGKVQQPRPKEQPDAPGAPKRPREGAPGGVPGAGLPGVPWGPGVGPGFIPGPGSAPPGVPGPPPPPRQSANDQPDE